MTELQTYAALRGRASVRLADFLHDQALELEDVYREGTGQGRSGWTTLMRDAGLIFAEPGPEEDYFSRRFGDLLHVDDQQRIGVVAAVGSRNGLPPESRVKDALGVQMLAYQIDGRHEQAAGPDALISSSSLVQRGISLNGESGVRRVWVDHHKDGGQHGRIEAVND